MNNNCPAVAIVGRSWIQMNNEIPSIFLCTIKVTNRKTLIRAESFELKVKVEEMAEQLSDLKQDLLKDLYKFIGDKIENTE